MTVVTSCGIIKDPKTAACAARDMYTGDLPAKACPCKRASAACSAQHCSCLSSGGHCPLACAAIVHSRHDPLCCEDDNNYQGNLQARMSFVRPLHFTLAVHPLSEA